MERTTDAFSLVELSIVLVILGLLTGGILTGQNLIRSAELRSVVTEFQAYQTAVNTFRDKYFALPGDMRNASDFWGALDGGDGEASDCFTLESTDGSTCNGNSDGEILRPTGGTGVWSFGERYHAWLQLSNAGLIEGSFTGRTDSTSASDARTPGKNVPKSKLGNDGWTIAYLSYMSTTGSANQFQGTGGGNTLGLQVPGQAYSTLSPEEAWNIDTKIDDSRPASGKMFSSKSTGTWAPGCTTTDDNTAEYNIANDVPCYILMMID